MVEERCSTFKLTASAALSADSSELSACPVCTGHADNSLLWVDKAAEAVSLNVEHRSSSIIPLGQNG